ncbi:MAG: hypothetical protein HY704_17490 [Gemmatimonadetes bacterium]|nr:hypothetical protein [Gemmatimonadota bacterium]
MPVGWGAADARGSLVLLPNLFYSPETGFGGGLVAGYYYRASREAPVSSLLGAAAVTTHRQFVLEWLPELHLEGRHLRAEFRASLYPEVFYGVGRAATEEMAEHYTSLVADLQVEAETEVQHGLHIGPRVRLRYEDLVDVEEGAVLDAGAVRGHDGGLTTGVGLVVTLDTRNDILRPRRGGYVELSWLVHTGILGSDFEFHRVVLDARRFIPRSCPRPAWHLGAPGTGEALASDRLRRLLEAHEVSPTLAARPSLPRGGVRALGPRAGAGRGVR